MIGEEKVRQTLKDLECPSFCIGFKYLSEAIMICYLDEDAIYNLEVNVYPQIAEKFGAHPKTVESDIRSVIRRSNEKLVREMSANKLAGKPTPKIFISIVVDHLKYISDD